MSTETNNEPKKRIRFVSKFPNIEIPSDVSIPDFVFSPQNREQFKDKTAIIDSLSSLSLSYGQLYANSLQLASGLQAHGVQKGSVLCMFATNGTEWATLFYSTLLCGGVFTTVNPSYTPAELLSQLQDSNPAFVFTQSSTLQTVLEGLTVFSAPSTRTIHPSLTNLKKIYLIDRYELSEENKQINSQNSTPIIGLLSDLTHYHASEFRPVSVTGEDVAAILYSSGTTGKSKGVCLTHRNLISNILQISTVERPAVRHDDVFIAFLPLYHVYALVYFLGIGLYLGATIVVIPKFNFQHYLQSVQKYRGTMLHIVPPVALLLGKHPAVLEYNLSSVRAILSGAAPLGEECEMQIQKRFPDAIMKQGFGMTELSPTTHVIPYGYSKKGSVGVIVPNVECKIVDPDTGDELPPGRLGELCCRGPNVMKGYLNNEAATKATIDEEGFLHTGDLVRCDEDGFFYIVDRLKELIKYKGFQVAPAELESLLLTHPSVVEACVVGKLDQMAGELPAAFVVLKPSPNQTLTESELMKWVDQKVAPHKRLRGGVFFVKEIPKSASGKLLRRFLRSKL